MPPESYPASLQAALPSNADELQRLPAAVRARLPEAEVHAQVQVARFNAALSPARRASLHSRLNALLRGKVKRRKALQALWAIADEYGAKAAPFAACKAGCAHCCHIPVAVAPAEARLIGSLTGRVCAQPPTGAVLQDKAYGYHRPCPFLKAGHCSIYAHRPLSCRVHFNMDRDALLCELVQGAAVPVPYLNMQTLQVAYVALNPEGFADIREFFPETSAPAS